jgi:hypothetical protein
MKRLLAGFGVGIATALAILAIYRRANPVPAGDAGPTVKLVLASSDLELGTILHEGDFMLANWPSSRNLTSIQSAE